jgi:hypothetical protein
VVLYLIFDSSMLADYSGQPPKMAQSGALGPVTSGKYEISPIEADGDHSR